MKEIIQNPLMIIMAVILIYLLGVISGVKICHFIDKEIKKQLTK